MDQIGMNMSKSNEDFFVAKDDVYNLFILIDYNYRNKKNLMYLLLQGIFSIFCNQFDLSDVKSEDDLHFVTFNVTKNWSNWVRQNCFYKIYEFNHQSLEKMKDEFSKNKIDYAVINDTNGRLVSIVVLPHVNDKIEKMINNIDAL